MPGNGDSYGGDEETTPAEPTGGSRISVEARALVRLGLEYSHAAECCWRLGREYDETSGDTRTALLSEIIVELSTIIDASAKARAALVIKRGEIIK
jgi:hypothetical protein